MSIVTKSTLAEVRDQFVMSRDEINFAGMALASHPKPVAEAIQRHRDGLDRHPYTYLKDNLHQAEEMVARKAEEYFGAKSENIALTDGTTSGLTYLYDGLPIRPDQEILTTLHEFSGELAIFDYMKKRQNTESRRIVLFDRRGVPPSLSVEGIVARLKDEIHENTRVLALTWVYSNTGVKLPLPEIGAMVRGVNQGRTPENRVLVCIDGVHGFGVENITFTQMACDFFVSGCHKWICGPRGTGIWCGTDEAWRDYHQVAPTSSRVSAGIGRSKSPGGVQTYEHRWALDVAFQFLLDLGKEEIERHVHGLCSEMKRELSQLPRVSVVTPLSQELSSGIICFDVEGLSAIKVVEALWAERIISTQSSSNAADETAPRHVRFSLSIFNTREEVARCLDIISKLRPAEPDAPHPLTTGATR